MRSRDDILTEFREFQDGELIAGTRYRVIRLIGVGGMGSVYEVEHVELGKRFVLKALLRELARREDLVARLRNEWRALARLHHANIVTVTDAGTSGTGVPFYVMERLDGHTLAVHLRQKRRLHVLEAVAISIQVLEALSAAHDIGIIHRDVKPANIFLAGGVAAVKLLDFGVAKIADATGVVTARGLAVGTPRYMSPEQARGERVDGRSDVYATGLILFEMIAGAGPFDDARDANELLLAHLARQAPALSSFVLGVAPELDRISASMLAKDCRARPLHARLIAEQLRQFVARHESVPASDARTSRANYGAATAVPAPAANLGPKHALPTRPDGVARGARGVDLHPSDEAPTAPIVEPTATQVTLTANTHEAFGVSSAPNTTYISAPTFDGSTTLEMTTLLPAHAPLAFATNGGGSLEPAVERPERTEILGELSPEMTADAVLTRTHIPPLESARPPSVTPPPVVDAGRPLAADLARRKLALVALLAASILLCLGLVGALIRRPLASAQPAPAAARPALVAVTTRVELPLSPAPEPQPVAAPGFPPSAVELSAHAPVGSEPHSIIIPSTKPSGPTPGPFLRATGTATVAVPATKPKPKHAPSALPASGL